MVQFSRDPLRKGQEVLFQFARRARVGKALLRYRTLQAIGARAILKTAYIKRTLLSRIFKARPIPSQNGLEVHMLLNHPKVAEAAWCLYSFAHFLKEPCHFKIHDDGSLHDSDNAGLKRLFPGIQIIRRKEADAHVLGELARRNLPKCIQFRKNFIFSLKLIDPYFYSSADYFVMLDSDILTYRNPQRITAHSARRECFFSEDNGYRACLSPAEFELLAGIPPPSINCNAGLLGVSRTMIDLDLIERWLESPSFWQVPYERASYYAEQTIWSLLMARGRAAGLGSGYHISAMNLEAENTISGHYCGGGWWSALFYCRGLPYLASQLSKAGVFSA
jgi:hypothetical protein